jgi:hypothetical protein
MSLCPNCKTKLGCSCQKRTSSTGIQCCTKCVASLEKKNKVVSSNKTGVILNVTASNTK